MAQTDSGTYWWPSGATPFGYDFVIIVDSCHILKDDEEEENPFYGHFCCWLSTNFTLLAILLATPPLRSCLFLVHAHNCSGCCCYCGKWAVPSRKIIKQINRQCVCNRWMPLPGWELTWSANGASQSAMWLLFWPFSSACVVCPCHQFFVSA